MIYWLVAIKIKKKFLNFPPVLVIEILSLLVASKDRRKKKELYQSQKVMYSVIVDSMFKKIEI